jgi:hypothetical protein
MKTTAFVLPLLAAACVSDDRPVDLFGENLQTFQEADAAGLPSSELAPPTQSLSLQASAFVPGQPMNFVVTGLNPNERVFIGRGMGGLGNGICIASAGGICLDIANPTFLLGTFNADATGVLDLTVTPPSTIPLGVSIGFQAVAIRGPGGDDSSKSNAVLRTSTSGAIDLTQFVPGDLVISEVMQNPNAVSDSLGEWFEVYNASNADIDINGLEVSDSGGASFVVGSQVIIGAGGFAVFGRDANSLINGGVNVDYEWSSFALGNTTDDIILSYGGVELDSVSWDDGATFPDPVGASMGLAPAALFDTGNGGAATLNDDGANWCESTSIFGAGDAGTPGALNDGCAPPPTETGDDGVLNQDETGIDCGGVCDACLNPSYETNEDFETGDTSLFPYVFDGPNPWTIETNPLECYGGDYCLRTSPLHALDELSATSLSLSVREDTTVSFWVRTNTEPGEHFFRFYIDGVLELELSGQNGWAEYTFPVTATGPNGSDRVLRWEYDRSTFVDPTHVPWNQVWVDDIDMPDWNTPPTVPAQSRPWNGQITTAAPTFAWGAEDVDFDTITYEMEYSQTADFSQAISTGETFATSVTPALTEGTWYWRVRSKDDSDFRWSAWSPTWVVDFDAAYPYDFAWQQTVADQFLMNDLGDGVKVDGDTLEGIQNYTGSWSSSRFISNGGTTTISLTGITPASTASTGTLYVEATGDYDGSSEYINAIRIDGTTLTSNWNPGSLSTRTYTRTISNIATYVNSDGRADIFIDSTSDVNSATLRARIEHSVSGGSADTTVTSYPIDFSVFGPTATVWDKVQWEGSGGTSVQVLDEQGVLLPDTVLPGNSAGFSDNTILLINVDVATYPALRLRADLACLSPLI